MDDVGQLRHHDEDWIHQRWKDVLKLCSLVFSSIILSLLIACKYILLPSPSFSCTITRETHHGDICIGDTYDNGLALVGFGQERTKDHVVLTARISGAHNIIRHST